MSKDPGSACKKGAQWQRARALLQEMRSQGLQADVITYNSTVSACGKGERLQSALELLEELHSLGLLAGRDLPRVGELFTSSAASLQRTLSALSVKKRRRALSLHQTCWQAMLLSHLIN